MRACACVCALALNNDRRAMQGEGTVYYYELVNEDPWLHLCGRYVSALPAVGIAQLHKTLYDVKEVEIFKVLKLNTTSVEPTSFKVPRTRVRYCRINAPAPAPALHTSHTSHCARAHRKSTSKTTSSRRRETSVRRSRLLDGSPARAATRCWSASGRPV